MMIKLICFLFLINNPILNAVESGSLYTLKDLEILEKEKNYEEFLQHANDIRPSFRNQLWKEMTENMALLYVNAAISKKSIDLKTFGFIESINLWPVLREDEFFQLKRENFALLYFKKCLNRPNNSNCMNEWDKFWASSRKPPELGLKMAEIIQTKNLDLNLWPYLQIAAKDDLSNLWCQRDILKSYLIGELIKIFGQKLSEFDQKMNIQNLAATQCYESNISYFKSMMNKEEDIVKRETLFLTLLTLNKLTTKEKDLFLLHYILKGPSVGDTFNLSWNNLRELGQNFPRRKAMMNYLKGLETLPDDLFASSDLSKKSELLNLLNQNFPEYLDYYSKLCLSFYEGTKKFPNGNPTMNCKEFYKLTNGKNILDSSWHLNFKKAVHHF